MNKHSRFGATFQDTQDKTKMLKALKEKKKHIEWNRNHHGIRLVNDAGSNLRFWWAVEQYLDSFLNRIWKLVNPHMDVKSIHFRGGKDWKCFCDLHTSSESSYWVLQSKHVNQERGEHRIHGHVLNTVEKRRECLTLQLIRE